MADPQELLIFADVLTTLETITVANGYHSAMLPATVAEGIKLWGEVHIDSMPYLGAALESIVNRELPQSQLQPTCRIVIVGHVYDETSPTTAALKLYDDVLASMYANHTRTANAIDSSLVDSFFDFRDPNKGSRALLEMHFEIEYPRTTSGS